MNRLKGYFFYITSKQLIILAILLFVLLTTIVFSLSYGSYQVSLLDLFNNKLSALSKTVFYQIRSPRVIFSAFVGASLALSGSCLQGLFRNPLADPGLIGVSAGAALGAALIIVLGSSYLPQVILSPYLVPISAVIGSTTVIFILYFATKGFKNLGISYLLLTGIAINSIVGVLIGKWLSSKISGEKISLITGILMTMVSIWIGYTILNI